MNGVYSFSSSKLFNRIGGMASMKKKLKLPKLTKEKLIYYQDKGMSDEEIDFFRETMAEAKEQIDCLEKNMNQLAKLKAINIRNNTVRTARIYFKAIVKEPDRLHQANKFLYTYLPNIVELTTKHVEINEHEIKNKQTYELMDESAKMIDEMSKLILADYQDFLTIDLEELEVEISVAKQSLSRDNKRKAADFYSAADEEDLP